LKPISTGGKRDAAEEEGNFPATPTAPDSRIPERLVCPPAPKKRKAVSLGRCYGGREFFNPPDLESIF
ncbi:hypothetical protein M569_02922, partial [Genlisea aurea]